MSPCAPHRQGDGLPRKDHIMNNHRDPRRLLLWLGSVVLIALAACTTAPTPLPALQNPTVELDHVEVASYFPWPAPVPTAGPQTPTPAPIPAPRVRVGLAFLLG